MNQLQREAHLRLQSTLPKHEHRMFDEVDEYDRRRPDQRRAVIIDGRRYESIKECMRRRRISRQTLNQMVRYGQARLVGR